MFGYFFIRIGWIVGEQFDGKNGKLSMLCLMLFKHYSSFRVCNESLFKELPLSRLGAVKMDARIYINDIDFHLYYLLCNFEK